MIKTRGNNPQQTPKAIWHSVKIENFTTLFIAYIKEAKVQTILNASINLVKGYLFESFCISGLFIRLANNPEIIIPIIIKLNAAITSYLVYLLKQLKGASIL